MNNNIIKYDRVGSIVIITLNRPEKLNAFNVEMINELNKIWKRFENDEEARVAIITGEGRAFSAGVDVNNPTPVSSAVPGIGVETTKPIIAAVNGHSVGLGFVISFMCDIRIVAEDATFMYPEAKLGVMGGIGPILASRIPLGIALEMLMVGDSISAKRAYEIGLANKVVPNEELLDSALEMAHKISYNAPMVLKGIKRLTSGTNIFEASALVNRITSEVMSSNDMQEGFEAFRENRKPNFTGQ